jgi:hypothetical protein
MKRLRVLVACEFSGTVRDAFAARGHDAWSCDLLPSERMGNHIQDDAIYAINSSDWDLMIAHPPCTRLTNAGVRWLHIPPAGKTLEEMWNDLEKGCAFYKALRDAPIPKKAIENPIFHKYARERIQPVNRQVVQPWYFGDPSFKATGFELINLPPLKDTNRLIPPKPGTEEHKKWSKVHRASPGPNRWKERSRTPVQIAESMADQWGNQSVACFPKEKTSKSAGFLKLSGEMRELRLDPNDTMRCLEPEE